MDPIEETLVATQNLLCALEQDSSLLRDKRFMEKLIYLRQKHKETSDALLKQTQFPSREHFNGATYHRSPGCKHYWSNLPPQFNYLPQRETRDEQVYQETLSSQNHGKIKRNSFQEVSNSSKKLIVQDVSTILNELKGYHRALRKQMSSKNENRSEKEQFENLQSYQPIPHSFRSRSTHRVLKHENNFNIQEPLNFRHFQSEVVEEDDLRTIVKSNSQSTSDLRETTNDQPHKESTSSLKKKATSIQDLNTTASKIHHIIPSSPNVTIPKPFTFMQRRYKGNTYARKFLEQMLVEKEQKEKEIMEEEKKIKKPFKAHPVPSTTYKSNNPRVQEPCYAEAVRKKLDSNLRLRSTLIKSKSLGDVTKFSVRPVPATTYITPDLLYTYRRGRESNRRAVLLLAEAHSPPGLKEHTYRTNLSFHLRHQHCRENVDIKKIRRQSVPDFRRLHRKFNEKLERVYSSKPPTVPVPFNLSENKKKHTHCQSVSPRRINSRRHSPTYEPVFPVHETHSSLLRTEAIKKRLEKESNEIEKKKKQETEHAIEMEMQRQKLHRSISRKRTDDIKQKVEDKRRALAETTREYERTLQDIKRKVLTRPLVMEQQSTSAQQLIIERRYKEALFNVTGITNKKKISIDTKTLVVPSNIRRNSAATGETFSVKSKRTSRNSSKSEKGEYSMSFESDDNGSSSKPSSGLSSGSGKSRSGSTSSSSS